MEEGLRIDGVLWILSGAGYARKLQPLCPNHHLRLKVAYNSDSWCRLECPEDEEQFEIRRGIHVEQDYILSKLDAKDFRKLKYINLDDEAIPIAEEKATSEDSKYFVTARLMRSKVGLRLVVYAGERGRTQKTQIFVEPDIKRIAFDQKDLHPTDVFVKLEGIFDDGSKHSIEKK
jgi:hypothetical protein